MGELEDEKKAAEARKLKDAEDKRLALLAAQDKDNTGDVKTDEPTDVTGKPKVDDDSGLGAWWILIILAILAVIGGAVYFFVFMPKEEDEEFDAEAQVEEHNQL